MKGLLGTMVLVWAALAGAQPKFFNFDDVVIEGERRTVKVGARVFPVPEPSKVRAAMEVHLRRLDRKAQMVAKRCGAGWTAEQVAWVMELRSIAARTDVRVAAAASGGVQMGDQVSKPLSVDMVRVRVQQLEMVAGRLGVDLPALVPSK
jgi:hypothetical protein